VQGIDDLEREGIRGGACSERRRRAQRAGKAEMLRVIIARRDLAAAYARLLDLSA